MLTFVLAVLAIVGFASLLNRIKKLERKLSALEEKVALGARMSSTSAVYTATTPAESSSPTKAATVTQPLQEAFFTQPPSNPAPVEVSPGAPWEPPTPNAWSQATESVFGLVKKNPFASAGVLMLLIGFGFLFSLLAANDILPPAVRVALVALAGAGMFGLGLWQEKSRPDGGLNFGLNLQGGALALEYLCGLWAYQGYGLIGSLGAFIWLGGLSILAFAWAVRTERILFAFIGLAGALLTPVIASTGEGTFSALALYSAWVSLLSIGVGLRLGAPSLASAALAGTSLLLGAALDLPRGSKGLSIAALVGMVATYGAAAIRWAWSSGEASKSQQASIVSVLSGAPLVGAAFLGVKAGVSAEWCAVLLGVTALAYLAAMHRAQGIWSGWLLAIGAGLGLIAIGVGLEGANRAIALAASAMGLILLAHASGKQWADLGALLYWGLSVAAGLHEWDSGTAGTTPLLVSGAVALGAGFVARGTALSLIYPMSAPLVFGIAILKHRIDEPTVVLVWFLAWAVAAQFLGLRLRWFGLRLSAAWLLPAGLFLLASSATDTSATGWIAREISLSAWLLGSSLLVWLYRHDREAPFRLGTKKIGVATLAIPVLCQVELARGMVMMGYSEHSLIAASIVLWSAWSAFAQWLSRRTQFDWQPVIASGAAAALILLGVASAPPGVVTEASQWAGVGLLALAEVSKQAYKKLPVPALWYLAGIVLIGSMLRAIGLAYGLDSSALALLFEREMQPWVSLLWAAGGMTVVVLASARKIRPMWVSASTALAVLVAKMLLVDLSAITLVAKVGVFLAVGLVFIGLGYFCPLPPESSSQSAAANAGVAS